jgi:hypothetical protein
MGLSIALPIVKSNDYPVGIFLSLMTSKVLRPLISLNVTLHVEVSSASSLQKRGVLPVVSLLISIVSGTVILIQPISAGIPLFVSPKNLRLALFFWTVEGIDLTLY